MIYQLTAAGKQERVSELNSLSHQAKVILFLIDGKKDLDEIKSSLNHPAGFVSSLSELVVKELIEEVKLRKEEPKSYEELKEKLYDLIKFHVPKQSPLLINKLQATEAEPAALKAALDTCCKIIKLTVDEEKCKLVHKEGIELIDHYSK